jgi:hypothetical protein
LCSEVETIIDAQNPLGDFAKIRGVAEAHCLAFAKYLRANEAIITAQLRPFVDFLQSEELKAQPNLKLLSVFIDRQSAQWESIAKDCVAVLARPNLEIVAANLERMNTYSLGSDMHLPVRAAEPPLKPKRKIGFDS